MILWSFQLCICLWFGYELVSTLGRNHFDVLQRFFAGVPIGFYTYSWMIFGLSSKIQLTTKISYIPFFLLLIISIALHKSNIKQKRVMTVRFSLLQIFTLTLGSIFYVLLMYYSMLRNDTLVKGAGYGDTPFHMNLISSFACGCNNKRSGFYDIQTPFFSGERLAYPFIPNFYSSIFMATGGATMRASLFWPSSFIILSFFFGQYSLCYKFTKDHLACLFSIVIFSEMGGLGWIKYVTGTVKGYSDYVYMWGGNQNEYWFHPLFHIIVPQRNSLWSFPLCYWTIFSLILGVEFNDWRLMLLAGIYTGFTPLVQVHSYVAMAQWSVTYCIVTFGIPFILNFRKYSKKKFWKQVLLWFVFAFSANVMAVPQLFPFFNRLDSAKNQFLQLNPIWKQGEKMRYGNFKGPLILWWRGLGVFFGISFFAGFSMITFEQFKIYIPSIVVFLIANFIRYQPWEMDNTKLFYGGWVPIALPIVGQFIARLFRTRAMFFISIIFIVSCCFSSVLHSIDCMRSVVSLFTKYDFEFGFWVAENTRVKDIFLTSDWHVHPAVTIGGRQLFMGFGGWVSSHGLDYWGRLDMRNKMFDNPHYLKPFERYNISYVISRNHEWRKFEQEFDRNAFHMIYNDNRYIVFKSNYI